MKVINNKVNKNNHSQDQMKIKNNKLKIKYCSLRKLKKLVKL
jgi:hypothetical protein